MAESVFDHLDLRKCSEDEFIESFNSFIEDYIPRLRENFRQKPTSTRGFYAVLSVALVSEKHVHSCIAIDACNVHLQEIIIAHKRLNSEAIEGFAENQQKASKK